jgi:RNA polymerase sigma factor (sigma-70 family)
LAKGLCLYHPTGCAGYRATDLTPAPVKTPTRALLHTGDSWTAVSLAPAGALESRVTPTPQGLRESGGYRRAGPRDGYAQTFELLGLQTYHPSHSMADAGRQPARSRAADTTGRLLARAQRGDEEALNDLFVRHVPALRRWARGRLPTWARDMADTHDLVQDTVFQAFKHVGGFEQRGAGALKAYLRQALLNRIRNEIRRVGRKPAIEELDEQVPSRATSPLQTAILHEQQKRYETALQRMTESDRELIVARLELGLTYEEIAEAVGKPSWNAARMAIARALLRLAEDMKRSPR